MLASVAIAAGCGRDGGWDTPLEIPGQPGSRREVLGGDRNVLPLVFVEKSNVRKWSYEYRLDGEPYMENEFLGLLRTIAKENSSQPVRIQPSTAMSHDEIELVMARIRETGMTTIVVVTPSGVRL